MVTRAAAATTGQEHPAPEMIDHDMSSPDEAGLAKRVALTYVAEAFAEAELDGIDGECVVQAALFAAFRHLVEVYGEEQTAAYAEALPGRIRSGGFSTAPRH
jgi:hypothetical protein